MRSQRRWTVMLVPDGCDSPRSISISTRALRRIAIGGAIFALVGVIGIGLAVSQFAAGGHDDTGPRRERVLALRARFDSLTDIIQAIQRRDGQIRLLAGLPADTLSPVLDAGIAERAPDDSSAIGATPAEDVPDVDGLIRRANSLAASFAEVSDTLAHDAEKFARIPSIMPTAGWLSSVFSRSRFHPILHIRRPHDGIDVSAPMGAPIVAPAAGVVTLVTRQTGYGNVLEIDHGNGIVTKYAHCSRIVVHQGEQVKRGQVIALVGNTGLSTGPHLHYEIHVYGKVVDPLKYVLPAGAIPD